MAGSLILNKFETKLWGSMPRARPDAVFVLAFYDGSLKTFHHAPGWGDRSGSRWVYVIDQSQQFSKSELKIPARDDIYQFSVSFETAWQISDPQAVVRNGLTSGEPVVSGFLRSAMRSLGRRFHGTDAAGAEDAINRTLRPPMDAGSGLTINGLTIRVAIDERLLKDEKEDHKEVRRQALVQSRVQEVRSIVGDANPEFLLLWANNPDDSKTLVDAIAENRARENQLRLDILDRLLDKNIIAEGDADADLLRQLLLHQPSVPPIDDRGQNSPPAITRGEAQLPPPNRVGGLFEASASVTDSPVPPTRRAYPLLAAPKRVRAAEVFRLDVGLSPIPTPHVRANRPGLDIPTTSFELHVVVLADGFELLGRASLEVTLDASGDDPYPSQTLRLRAIASDQLADERDVFAQYYRNGVLLGIATRRIIVGDPAGSEGASSLVALNKKSASKVRPTGQHHAVDWVMDSAVNPDVQITVTRANTKEDTHRTWVLASSVPDVHQAGPTTKYVGPDVAEFIHHKVMRGVEEHGREGSGDYLRGVGQAIADAVPHEIWNALGRTAHLLGRPPSVLLATDDAIVPWELAVVPAPWDPTSPPFLGAQAIIGRWLHSTDGDSPAPPADIVARRMAVVSGTYSNGRNLPQATAEADHLVRTYAAQQVRPLRREIKACMLSPTPPDILHFAVHGGFDVTGSRDGILLIDDSYLSPYEIRAYQGTGTQLIFLNACQVGQGQDALGQASGVVPAFLKSGVHAAIAPLWSVDDAGARHAAEAFYGALSSESGCSPAEFLRDQRVQAQATEDSATGATLTAYVFFGHPLLRVRWAPDETGKSPVEPSNKTQ